MNGHAYRTRHTLGRADRQPRLAKPECVTLRTSQTPQTSETRLPICMDDPPDRQYPMTCSSASPLPPDLASPPSPKALSSPHTDGLAGRQYNSIIVQRSSDGPRNKGRCQQPGLFPPSPPACVPACLSNQRAYQPAGTRRRAMDEGRSQQPGSQWPYPSPTGCARDKGRETKERGHASW